MMNVFTYGSLMYPEVFSSVTLASPRCLGVCLDGWSRHAIQGKTYPGAVPAAGATITGVLWLDLSDEAMQRLDRFEGNEYARQRVWIGLAGGERIAAQIYRWRDIASLLPTDWSSDEFERHHLSEFFRIHGT